MSEMPPVPHHWQGSPLVAGAIFQFDNVRVQLHPDGYIHMEFVEYGGAFELETFHKISEFLRYVHPEGPGAGLWIIKRTRPSLGLREVSRKLSPEELGLAQVATVVVTPVGAIIMRFFVNVLKTPIPMEVFPDEQAAAEFLIKGMKERGFTARWVRS